MPSLLAISRLLTPRRKSFLTSAECSAIVRGPAVRAAFLAGLGDPGLHAIAEDVPLELGEDSEHAGQRPPLGVVRSSASLSETKPTRSAVNPEAS